MTPKRLVRVTVPSIALSTCRQAATVTPATVTRLQKVLRAIFGAHRDDHTTARRQLLDQLTVVGIYAEESNIQPLGRKPSALPTERDERTGCGMEGAAAPTWMAW